MFHQVKTVVCLVALIRCSIMEQDTIEKNYSIFSFSPEVSQFLKLVDNQEVSCFVEPLDLISKEVIILAVNNASDPSQPGGSHWSLLVYTSQVIL